MTSCVWLGRGVSNNVWLIQALRARGLRVIGSHGLSGWAGARYLDETFHEPDLGGAAYRAWFERVLRDRTVIDLALPGRQLGAFGTIARDLVPRVLLGSVPERMACLDDKAQTYAWARSLGLSCAPDVAIFEDLAGFDDGVRALRATGHGLLCCKPTVGLFGQGFWILEDTQDAMDRLLHGAPTTLPMATFRAALAQTERVAPKVLMPAFDGPEVSIDGAWDGQGYRLVAREKHASGQRILTDGAMERLGQDLAWAFELRGLFNIQVMRHEGRWWLLEINPRAAGGLGVVGATNVDVVGAALHPFHLGTTSPQGFNPSTPAWPDRERWVFDEVHKVPAADDAGTRQP